MVFCSPVVKLFGQIAMEKVHFGTGRHSVCRAGRSDALIPNWRAKRMNDRASRKECQRRLGNRRSLFISVAYFTAGRAKSPFGEMDGILDRRKYGRCDLGRNACRRDCRKFGQGYAASLRHRRELRQQGIHLLVASDSCAEMQVPRFSGERKLLGQILHEHADSPLTGLILDGVAFCQYVHRDSTP